MKTIITLIIMLTSIFAIGQDSIKIGDKYHLLGETEQAVWESGMNLKVTRIDSAGGMLYCEINEGVYYRVYSRHVGYTWLFQGVNVENVIYSKKTLIIYVERGEVKSSFDNIKSKDAKSIFVIWEMVITIKHAKIINIELMDCRQIS